MKSNKKGLLNMIPRIYGLGLTMFLTTLAAAGVGLLNSGCEQQETSSETEREAAQIVRPVNLSAQAISINKHEEAENSASMVLDKVILISVDTLRSDFLGCYNPSIHNTPNIDSLALRGVLFEDAYCNFPMTTPSHVTMLSGLYSWTHRVRANSMRIPDMCLLLPEILKDHGWSTGGFVSLRTLDARIGFNRGFDVYDDKKTMKLENAHFRERRGMETIEVALEWLEQHLDDKVFMFLHLADPHGPYSPPEEYVKDLPPPFRGKTLPFGRNHEPQKAIPLYQRIGNHKEVDFYIQRYYAEISYVDHCMQFFIEALENWKIFDRCLIIFTSDHGEAMGEHKRWFQHGTSLYYEQTKVPLIFIYPGAKATKIRGIAQIVDITPTILDFLQIQPPQQMQGKSLLPRFNNPVLPVKTVWYGDMRNASGIEKEQFKLIFTKNKKYKLFDVSKDKGEKRNLADEFPERAVKLKKELNTFIKSGPKFKEKKLKLPPEERQEMKKALESLGYVK